MQFPAREVTTQRYHTLTPDHTVAVAARLLITASQDDGNGRQRKTNGRLVTFRCCAFALRLLPGVCQ